MPYNLINTPAVVQAVYNPIKFTVEFTDYQIGDLFYVDVYSTNTTDFNVSGTYTGSTALLTSLRKNGLGTGICSFDLSHTLTALFTGYTVPMSSEILQLDTEALKGYQIKAGIIRFDNNNNELKTEYYDSGVKYVLRSAYELDSTEEASEYLVDYTSEVKYLNSIPDNHNIRLTETSFLSVLVPFRDSPTYQNRLLILKANLYLKDGTTQNFVTLLVQEIFTGGVYLYNVAPTMIFINAELRAKVASYEVWVEYSDSLAPVYTATQSYTATCGADFFGNPLTKTVTATAYTQTEAIQLAYTQAKEQAESEIVCTPYMVEATATYTAYCPDGKTGNPVTVTKTAKATSEQLAYSFAMVLAKQSAEAQLVCTVERPVVTVTGFAQGGEVFDELHIRFISNKSVAYNYLINYVGEGDDTVKTVTMLANSTETVLVRSKRRGSFAADFTYEVRPSSYDEYQVGSPSSVTLIVRGVE